MAYEIDSLKSAGVAWETTFGQNGSGSLSYVGVPAVEISTNAAHRMLDVAMVQQRLDARTKSIAGPRDQVSCQLKVHAYGVGGSGVTGSIPDVPVLATLLQNAMGGLTSGKGAAVVSVNGDKTQVTVTTASGSQWKPGMTVGFMSGNSGRMEVVPVMSRSLDTLYLAYPLSFTPSAADRAYNSFTAYLTTDPTGSLQCFLQGYDSEDKWVFTGLKGGVTLDSPVGELPAFTFPMAGVDFHTGSSTNTLAMLSYLGNADSPMVFYNSRVVLTDVPAAALTSTLRVVDTPEVSTNLNLSYAPLKTPGGVNNVIRHRRTRSAPVASPDISLYYDDNRYWQIWKDRTNQLLNIQIGSQPGNIVFIQIPNNQVMNVQRKGMDDISGLGVSLAADIDRTTATGEGEELAQSAIRISLM